MDDAVHIKRLEQLLGKKQQEIATAKRQLDQWFGMGVDDYWLTRSRAALDLCRAEADAIDWALEKLTS